jgi:hypothetical protein
MNKRPMVITADQARTLHVEGAPPEALAVERMIDRTDKIIRACSAQGIRRARLVVPLWLVGVPVYDRNVVKAEVMAAFRANGFDVFDDDIDGDDDEGSFGVSWEPRRRPPSSPLQRRRVPDAAPTRRHGADDDEGEGDEDEGDGRGAATAPASPSTLRLQF